MDGEINLAASLSAFFAWLKAHWKGISFLITLLVYIVSLCFASYRFETWAFHYCVMPYTVHLTSAIALLMQLYFFLKKS